MRDSEKVIYEFTLWSEFSNLNKKYTVEEIIKIFENENNKKAMDYVLKE